MEWIYPLKWIGGTLLAVLGARFGIGKLLENWQQRRFAKKDRELDEQEMNEAKQIDADVNAFNAVMKRLEHVEHRVDEVSEKLSLEMAKSAGLEAENKALRKDNERMELEIQRQRENLHKLRNEVQQRDAHIYALQHEMKMLKDRFDLQDPRQP